RTQERRAALTLLLRNTALTPGTGRRWRGPAQRAMRLRPCALQRPLSGLVDPQPDTHKLDHTSRGQRLGHEPRPTSAAMYRHPLVDIRRPAEIVLPAVHRPVEVQKIAPVHA